MEQKKNGQLISAPRTEIERREAEALARSVEINRRLMEFRQRAEDLKAESNRQFQRDREAEFATFFCLAIVLVCLLAAGGVAVFTPN